MASPPPKHRQHKSLAVMFRDIAAVKKLCEVNEAEEAELLSTARPIVLLTRKLAETRLGQGTSPDTGRRVPALHATPSLSAPGFAIVMGDDERPFLDEPIIPTQLELPTLLGPNCGRGPHTTIAPLFTSVTIRCCAWSTVNVSFRGAPAAVFRSDTDRGARHHGYFVRWA